MTPLPNAGQIRAVVPGDYRRRTYREAFRAVAPMLGLYLVSAFATACAPWWLWLPLIAVTGTVGSIVFVIGHDAAHDALSPSPRLNASLARLLFLPAWHPYTGWVHAHNHVHHGWTNYQPKDYVWSPLSWEQYRALSPWRRWLFRSYRRWSGFGSYYLGEVLLKKIWRVQPEIRRAKTRWLWRLDDAFVVVGVAAKFALMLAAARALGSTTPAWLLFIVAEVLPAYLANYLVGFITYLQHTHPLIPWFQDLKEWNFYTGQILGTTHTHFPGRINHWIQHIMEHTAHHVDPRIPLYHLPEAQDCLQEEHPAVDYKFSWHAFAYIQRVCKLYDFQRHCWLDFSGEPTSSRTISDDLLAQAAEARGVKPAQPLTG